VTPAEVAVVLATAPEEAAGRIARALVDERLAACVNVVPGVRSVYRWEGATEEAIECLLVIKTRRERWADLEARLRALHPYAVPEILSLATTAGLPDYLEWVGESVTAKGGE
jgi:periplasmic divalent cation tolerance protein